MPRIQHKRGTSANLASVNPTPLAGELVWDSTENAVKIGDGSTAWASLAYVTATPRTHVHDGGDITTGTVAYARLPVGSTASTVCAGDDARLSDARSPTAHTHLFSEISDITFPSPLTDNSIVRYTAGVGWGVANAIGTIGVGSQPLGGWPAGSVGASLAGKVDTSDARLSDARTPTAHKSSHATGGSDALTPSDIGAAPAASPTFTGNATFDASSGVPVTITNTGTGNSFVVNDASGDTTPFVVDASGNVGIGLSSPTAELHVFRDGANADIKISNNNATNGLTLTAATNSVATINQRQNAPLVIATNNTEAVRIDASGNLLVGTTTASSLLTVNGVITVSATSGSSGSYLPSVCFASDANTGLGQVGGADSVSLITAGSERVRVKSTGAVRFVPLASDPASGEAGDVYFNLANNELRYHNGSAFVGAAPAASPEFTGVMTVAPSGPWSLGYLTTTGDGLKISNANTVDGIGNYGAGISWTRNATANNRNAGISSVQTSNDPDQTGLAFFVHGSTTASADMVEAARLTHARFFGIGTPSPASALDVNGVITVAAGTPAAPAIVASGDSNTGVFFPAADTFAISTAGVERLRVDASGNIRLGGQTSNSGVNLIAPNASGTDQAGGTFVIGGAQSTGTGAGGSISLATAGPSGTSGTALNGRVVRIEIKSNGVMRFHPRASDPASGEAGDVYYNSTDNKLRVYNGTSWIDLH